MWEVSETVVEDDLLSAFHTTVAAVCICPKNEVELVVGYCAYLECRLILLQIV